MTPDTSSRQLRYFHIQRACFAALGIDIEATAENAIILKWPARYLLSTLATLFLILLMCAYTVKYHTEVDKLVKAMTVIVQGVVSILKAGIFLTRGRRLIRLLTDLDSLASQANEEECKIWALENQRQQLIARAYYTSCSVTGVLYCTVPLLILLLSYLKGHTVQILPFEALYPYDYEQPILYVISYVWCLTFTVYAVHAIVSTDTLFCWLIFNISAHFYILQQKLQRIATDLCEDNYTLFQWQIASVVRYHRRIIALAAEFRDLFSPIIFVEVAVSCLKLCFTAYQLSSKTEPSMLLIILFTLVTVFMQLTIYCFSGEKIKIASEMTAGSIYLSFPWERMSPAMKRLLLLPLMRAQRNITITGYLFVIDRSLLVWIFKTTASIIGLLSAVKDGKQDELFKNELIKTEMN